MSDEIRDAEPEETPGSPAGAGDASLAARLEEVGQVPLDQRAAALGALYQELVVALETSPEHAPHDAPEHAPDTAGGV